MERTEQVPAIMHVHTRASGGRYNLEEIGRLARERGIGAVLVTDKAQRDWSYGMAPFRGVLRLNTKERSISMSEIDGFLSGFSAAEQAIPEIIWVPGLEVAPHYRWEGEPRQEGLTLLEWDRELLVFGLKSPEDWRGLPFIGNPATARFTFHSIAALVFCLILIVSALLLFFRRRPRSFKVGLLRKQRVRYHVYPYRPLSLILLLVSLFLTCLWFPFKRYPYSPYGESPRGAPHQMLIDYVAARGGLTVWSHPESRWDERFDAKNFLPSWLDRIPYLPFDFEVRAVGKPYSKLLKETAGFTAFASLYEGNTRVAPPGGIWDEALIDFIRGKREEPYWTVGELDYYGDEAAKPIDHVQTVFLAGERTREGLLEAFRAGSMYVLKTERGVGLRLIRFSATSGGKTAWLGEGVSFKDRMLVIAEMDSYPESGIQIRADLIRDGEIIHSFVGETPVTFEYVDDQRPEFGMSYYRLDASAMSQIKLISNPVFVCRQDLKRNARFCH